jgi:hypothetical protein
MMAYNHRNDEIWENVAQKRAQWGLGAVRSLPCGGSRPYVGKGFHIANFLERREHVP